MPAAPSPSSSNSPSKPASTSPVNPDGTINYGALLGNLGDLQSSGPVTHGTKTPVDTSGMVSVWGLPSYLTGTKPPELWFATGHERQRSTEYNEQVPGAARAQDTTPIAPDRVNSFSVKATAEEVMKQFAALSQSNPGEYAALQKLLQQAGYLDATSVKATWTTTEKGLVAAITDYYKISHGAGAAVSFVQFLQNTSDSNTQINGQGGANGPTQVGPTLDDPTTLRATAQQAAQQALGKNLTEDELTKFVDQFHAQQTGAFNAHAAGDSTTSVDAPGQAFDFIMKNHQGDFKDHQINGYTDAFLNMFLPQGSRAPDINPDAAATQIGV